jgi:ribosomal protein S18 acetylase RimI-like enzyme
MPKVLLANETHAREILPLIEEYFPYHEITMEELMRRLQSDHFWFHQSMEKNQLIGYAEWEILDAKNKVVRLNGIALLKKFHRKGMGNALLKEGENTAQKKGMKKMILLVAEKNIPAKKLYQKNGWKFERMHMKKINGEKTEVWEKELK